jgi:hypothetical protein
VLEVVVGLADRRRREGVRCRDVRAGPEVRVVDLGDDGRPRDVEKVGVALDVATVAAQALAAVVGLGEAAAVDEHAPRPVEHGNSTIEDLSQLIGRGRGHGLLVGRLLPESPTEVRAGGSLGVW